MKVLAWILIWLAVVVFVGMLWLTLAWWDFWGFPESSSEAFLQFLPVLIYPVIPGLIGYLLLRSVRKKEHRPSDGS